MIFLIALRNIVRNKKNSIIVILLIAVITALFFIGNSVINSSNTGLEQSYVDASTSDIIIEKKSDVTMSLYGANAPIIDNYFSISVLDAHNTIMNELRSLSGIESVTSQVSATAYFEVFDERSPVLLCGVDARTYFEQLPGIELIEGSFLAPNEYGAMITKERADAIEKQSGKHLEIGEPLLFTSAGLAGFKIREVPLAGIFSYKTKGRFLDEIVIADAQTVRVLSAIQVATADVEVSDEAQKLLTADINDMFDLFGTDDDNYLSDPLTENNTEITGSIESFSQNKNNKIAENETDILQKKDFSQGEWNFILVRLKAGENKVAMLSKINKLVAPFGAAAYNWRIAAGTSAILVLLLQLLFNAGIALVSVAGIIAIINILLISVFRRTREIGTLRAIGASDSYIRLLVLSENIVLAVVAGIVGVVIGYVSLKLVNGLRLHIGNDLLANLFGGETLHIGFVGKKT
ncbi:MAG: FtsX-like permease family protein [Termitinemataceae bacterium]|nr:MAG: FtsX-like permease family protein [Termitinemataceae bacterium]